MNIVSETEADTRGREHEILRVLQVTLPRRGKMRCPTLNHDDRDSSWRWDGRRARWRCACGGGDILDLAQAMGFADSRFAAALWVRRMLNMPLIADELERAVAGRPLT